MKILKSAAMAVLITMTVSGGAYAAEDGANLYKTKSCVACHGKEGLKPIMPAYPNLAGQNAKYLENQMQDIKSGKRANGQANAMKPVMHLVNDEQIKAIADYLSKVKAP